MKTHLIHDYYMEIAEDRKALFQLVSEHRPKVFSNDINLFIEKEDIWTEEEKAKVVELRKNIGNLFQLRLLIYQIRHDEQGEEVSKELVGWTFGWQRQRSTYYMTNTAVFEAHRRKGIYKTLLTKVLEILKEKGFRKVTSRHQATNNAVIIPKLQVGFVISGFEISGPLGILVHLSYFFKEEEQKLMEFRAGQKIKDNPTVEKMYPLKFRWLYY